MTVVMDLVMDLVHIMETKLKIKQAELNCLAGEVERLKSMVDNLDKVIDQHLTKEKLIFIELAKEGYTINFSKDENGELKCNLNKEEQ